MDMATNIKRLRQRDGLTQEDIARRVGCSVQAVSRWERGEGYPEITLLPQLTALFNVTADELLGMDETRVRVRKDALWTERRAALAVSDYDAALAVTRSAVDEFPDDDTFANELAVHLLYFDTGSPNRDERCREGIAILERLAERGTDYQKYRLRHAYATVGEYDKARELLGSPWISRVDNTQIAMLEYPKYAYGEDRIITAQTAMHELLDSFVETALVLADEENRFATGYSAEQRIAVLQKALEVYDAAFCGEYGFNALHPRDLLTCIARLTAQSGDTELAAESLVRAAEYALLYDANGYDTPEPKREKRVKSPLFLGYDMAGLTVSYQQRPNESWTMLNVTFASPAFDEVRGDPRVVAAAEELAKSAKIILPR